jgi:hypothetical protein
MQHIATLSCSDDKVKMSREQKKTEAVKTKAGRRLITKHAYWVL